MNTTYFTPGMSVAEIKSTYKTLALRWHPDRPGGNTVIMQEINAAYKVSLSRKHGEVTEDSNGKEHTYYYRESTEQAVIDKIAETIASGILNNPRVELWLIGTWLWVKGDTKPHRMVLGKELKFSWNSAKDRLCWQWHQPTGYRHTKSEDGFESIAARYSGSRVAYQPQTLEE